MSEMPAKRPLGVAIALLALGLAAGGFAAQAPAQEAPLPEQIASAKTRADHDKIAVWYEQAAAAAHQKAQAHQEAEERYQRFPHSGLYSTHHVTTAAFMQRCQSTIRANEQAAEDDLALAKLHRDLTAEAKE